MSEGHVYLIHLEDKLNPDHPCQHYVGWSQFIEQRIGHHRRGNGCKLLRAANERGVAWNVVRVWRGSGDDERLLKNQKNAPRYCPIYANGRGPAMPDWMAEDPDKLEEVGGWPC
jgi:predicted GIY-YIG superfamily endonuclease